MTQANAALAACWAEADAIRARIAADESKSARQRNDETITRLMTRIDAVDTHGSESLRVQRKTLIGELHAISASLRL